MMHEIGRKLNLKPHLVRGTSGALKEIVGPIDIEGHIGDGAYRNIVTDDAQCVHTVTHNPFPLMTHNALYTLNTAHTAHTP